MHGYATNRQHNDGCIQNKYIDNKLQSYAGLSVFTYNPGFRFNSSLTGRVNVCFSHHRPIAVCAANVLTGAEKMSKPARAFLCGGTFDTGGVGVSVRDESSQLYIAFHKEEDVGERTSGSLPLFNVY